MRGILRSFASIFSGPAAAVVRTTDVRHLEVGADPIHVAKNRYRPRAQRGRSNRRKAARRRKARR